MSLLWMSGFEGGVDDFDVRSSHVSSTPGIKRSGAYSFRRSYSGGGTLGVKYIPNTTDLYGQVATYRVASGTRNFPLVSLSDGTTGAFRILIDSMYCPYMEVPSGTLAGATSLTSIPTTTWVCYEFHFKIHPTEGVAEVRADGQTICYYQGKTDFISYVSQVYIGSVDDDWYVDDIVLNDSTGSFNNSWTGCQYIVYLPVSADGSITQWTPTPAGLTHYTALDEIIKSASEYVSTLNSTDEDFFQLSNLPAAATAIISVQTCLWARKSSATSTLPNVLTGILTSGITTWSTPLWLLPDTFTPDYSSLRVNWDHNPVTGHRWTVDEINDLHIGIKAST